MNRTDQQRKGIEVYCKLLADAFNDGGYDMKAVLTHKAIDVPWKQDRIKDILWRSIQIALLNKESTTELDPNEVSQVYEVLDRWTSEKLGIHVEFPDRYRVPVDAYQIKENL